MVKKSTKSLKAYENMEFLHSPDARLIRIMAEFMYPQKKLREMQARDTIVFFGSARAVEPAKARRNLEDIQSRMIGAKRITPAMKKALKRAQAQVGLSSYYADAMELARRLTSWSMHLPTGERRFLVCSGGGPGIMEAVNRGASMVSGGKSIGFNISIPHEQEPNPYISPELNFEFHYFFVRKYWFVYLAKALVIFPGGFGTMDELMEVLTLIQTRKVVKPIPVVIYGSDYWHDVLNFEAFVRWGTIDEEDLKLFKMCDSVDGAFDYLTSELIKHFTKLNGPDRRKIRRRAEDKLKK